MHRAWPLKIIGLALCRKKSVMHKIITEHTKQWGIAGKMFSYLSFDEEFLVQTYPTRYKRCGLEKIAALVDGKDFLAHVTRASSACGRAMHSNKMSAPAFRILTWTLPGGLCFYHTELFGARLSEERLLALYAKRLDVLPEGWRVLADKGFATTAHLYPNLNPQVVPHFLKKRDTIGKQFWESEVRSDHFIKTLRYTSET